MGWTSTVTDTGCGAGPSDLRKCRRPLQVARRFGRGRVLSMEPRGRSRQRQSFDGVDGYDVMDASALPTAFPESMITRTAWRRVVVVFNIHAGLEYKFKDQLTGYWSVTTDRSAAVPGGTPRHALSTWNIYHISIGAALDIGGLDLPWAAGIFRERGYRDIVCVGPIPGRRYAGRFGNRLSRVEDHRRFRVQPLSSVRHGTAPSVVSTGGLGRP